MIRVAVVLVIIFVILELCGGRSATSFLSGSSGEVSPLGAAYLLGWFGAVIAAPILGLAALLSAAYGRICAWTATRRR